MLKSAEEERAVQQPAAPFLLATALLVAVAVAVALAPISTVGAVGIHTLANCCGRLIHLIRHTALPIPQFNLGLEAFGYLALARQGNLAFWVAAVQVEVVQLGTAMPAGTAVAVAEVVTLAGLECLVAAVLVAANLATLAERAVHWQPYLCLALLAEPAAQMVALVGVVGVVGVAFLRRAQMAVALRGVRVA